MADGKHQIQVGDTNQPMSTGPGNAALPLAGTVSGAMLSEAMKGPSGPAPSLQEHAQPKK